MIFVTGDLHGELSRFSAKNFPIQKQLTRKDVVFVCGDFGVIWSPKAYPAITKDISNTENYNLKWLSQKNFTIAFVDGNHENFDRYYSDEFPIVDFYGAKAHQISENVFHILRGEIATIEGKTFFCFGGAASHDIEDGIVKIDTPTREEIKEKVKIYKELCQQNKMVRLEHYSWWKQELPSLDEINAGAENLYRKGFQVDYIISHCGPETLVKNLGIIDKNVLTEIFDVIVQTTDFSYWFFGHYHLDSWIGQQYRIIYKNVIRIC